MSEPGELEILAGLRARRPETGELFIRQYYGSVYRFLAVLTCDGHRAEDLTQETFAAAWGGLDGFTRGSSLRTWLHRIAYRKFVDEFRRRRRQTTAMDRLSRQAEEADPGDAGGPLGRIVRDERLTKLSEAIARLTPSDRAVLAARYVQELNSEQIGRLLGKPAGTVRTRLHKALGRLRSMLDGEIDA